MSLGIHNYAEIISAVICTICFFYKPSVLNGWFIWFLWLTVAVEFAGKLTVSKEQESLHYFIYNLFSGVEFGFYLSFIYTLSKEKLLKRILLSEIIIFFAFFLINLLFFQRFANYNSLTTAIGSVLILLTCLILYFEISFSESNYLSYNKWPLLWIISGLAIFYVGNLVTISLYNYILAHAAGSLTKLYLLINHSLNVPLYGFFSIALILEVYQEKKEV